MYEVVEVAHRYKLQYPTKAIQSHHRRTRISWLRRHPEKQQVPAANTQTPLPQGHPWKVQTSPRWATETLSSSSPIFSGWAGAEHRFLLLPLLLSAFSYGLHAPFSKRRHTKHRSCLDPDLSELGRIWMIEDKLVTPLRIRIA